MKTAFIGLGIMGSRMAMNLQKNGVDLTVYNRTPEKADDLVAAGAHLADSVSDAVSDADVVFTMLATPDVVQSHLDAGLLGAMKSNALWVDSSTVAPADARHFAAEAQIVGIRYLEAPVTGTKQPAESGELVFLCGGAASDIEMVADHLSFMGQKHLHIGEPGMAASLKIIVNQQLAHSVAAYSEAIHLADKMGLDIERTQEFLAHTPVVAPLIKNLNKKWEAGDRSPNFPLYLMRKDVHLFTKTAYEHGISTPLTAALEQQYTAAMAVGLGSEDLSSIYHYVREE